MYCSIYMSDIPYLNKTDIRGLFYVHSINQELNQERPATISQLVERSEWRSNYYTTLWQSLAPQLIDRTAEGNRTRLSLTEEGEKAVAKYQELNQLFDEVGL